MYVWLHLNLKKYIFLNYIVLWETIIFKSYMSVTIDKIIIIDYVLNNNNYYLFLKCLSTILKK